MPAVPLVEVVDPMVAVPAMRITHHYQRYHQPQQQQQQHQQQLP